jgi:hypothetical protein
MPKPQLQQAAAMIILSNTTIIPARQCSTKQTASKLATSGIYLISYQQQPAAVGEMVASTTVEPTSPHGPHERRERREQTAFAVARNFYLILSYLSYCIVAIARVVVGLLYRFSAAQVCGKRSVFVSKKMEPTEAAEAREELAWSSYTALSALAFISRDDLVRELVVIAGHTITGTSGDADAPVVSESMVTEFLQLQGMGIPEGFDEFVELHNRLIDWALASSGSTGGAALRLSPGRRSNSPLGRSISHAASHRAMETSPESFRARPPSDLVLINPTEDAPGLISPVACRRGASASTAPVSWLPS